MLPVGMPRTRLNTFPKITSHKIGCTAREKSSVGSRKSFLSSMAAIIELSLSPSRITEDSPQAAGCAAELADIAVIPSLLEARAAEGSKNVVERGGRAKPGLQVPRLPDDGDRAE